MLTSINEIESILVHWSESELINDELGCDDNGDIEKAVSPSDLDELVKRAAVGVGSGYDKTVLTILLKSGESWCEDYKFYLTGSDTGLLSMINRKG